MKSTVLFLAAMMTISCGFAQSLNKKEAKALLSYLSQPSAKGGTNAQALGVNATNLAVAPGIKIENGHVTEIDWKGKDLAGDLNLSGFDALTQGDVSDNKIV